MFSLLYNVHQNLTIKRPTSAIPSIPKKIPGNSKSTSPHVTNTVRNKRLPLCTTENYLNIFIPITVPGNSDYASFAKNGRKVLVVGDSHVKRI